MAANNNRSSKSSNNKSANNKGKSSTSNDMLLLLLILLICGVFVGLYYMQKRQNQREGFENDNDSDTDDADNNATLSSKSKNSTKNNKLAESFATGGSLEPQSGECVIALFYADWCPHCQHFKPEFKKAMSKLNGKMNNKNKTMRFEMVDCDADKNIAKKYDVSGFPTVKILNDDATTDEYSGDRTYEGLRKYLVSDD